jgi:hypothetical protein
MRTAGTIALLCALSGIGCASRAPAYDAYVAMPQAEDDAGGGADERAQPAVPPKAAVERPHGVRMFLGGASEREGGGFVLGGQYEYRMQDKLGLGGFLDLTFGDEVATTLGGAVYWHPANRVTLLAGPGVELDGSGDVFVRLGGSYEFPVDRITLAPAAYVDVGADGTPVLLGLLVGWRF